MDIPSLTGNSPEVDLLHEIGSRIAAANPLREVLGRVVDFIGAIVKCDSCLIYVLENDELVLRASKNPHPGVVGRLRINLDQGITGWVAQHHRHVTVAREAIHPPASNGYGHSNGNSAPAPNIAPRNASDARAAFDSLFKKSE
jgi:signal transduction protein with GAF and PtsI domain